MSFAFTLACRSLVLPPTQKAVLMALADYCHDESGKDWHSAASISEWTCLGRTAVLDALKGLEARGLIVIDRAKGRGSVTWLQLDRIKAMHNQSATRTSPPAEPVRQPDHPSPPAGPPPVRHADEPVRQPDPKHQEASEKHQEAPEKKTRGRAPAPPPEGVDPQVWSDWLEVRKGKRAGKVTLTALEGLGREAAKAGISEEAAIRFCVEANWVGFNAGWYAERLAKRGTGGTGDVIDARDVLPGWRLAELERSKATLGPAFSQQSEELLRRHHAASGTGRKPGARPQNKHIGFDAQDYSEGVSDGRIV